MITPEMIDLLKKRFGLDPSDAKVEDVDLSPESREIAIKFGLIGEGDVHDDKADGVGTPLAER